MARPPVPDGALRRVAVALVVVATTALATGTGTGTSAAAPSQPFSGTASADGVRLLVAAPGFLVVERFSDLGAPSAQSSADPLLTSGYAGYPWPGQDTYGLLATAGAPASQDLTNVPTAVRSSSTTTAHDHKENGPVVLDALSTDSSSTSSARAPLVTSAANAGSTRADSSVVHDASGEVVSKAAASAEAFDLAGVLRIGGVSATAQVTAPLGGPRKRVTTFQASDVTIAGQTVGITDKGLVLPGTTTPLPADNPLVQVLADQDISVTYLAPETSTDGITSAGLRITIVRALDQLPEPVQIAYVLGRAHAAATAGLDATADPVVAQPLPAEVGPTDAPAVPGVVTVPSSAPVVLGPVPAIVPTTTQSPVVGAPAARSVSQVRTVAALRVDGAWYLVLVLGGLVMTVCASLLRLFGVKGVWS